MRHVLPLLGLALCLVVGRGPAHAQSSSEGSAADLVGFGRALAVGANHVYVGAPQDVNTPGRVYVYARDENGTWRERTFLEARQGTVGDGFGSAIESADDMLAVGAPSANAVYLFRADGDQWTQTARLTPTDSTRKFGTSLGLRENRLYVGTRTTLSVEDGDTTRTGAVHIYRRRGEGPWRETHVLRSDHVQDGARFGHPLVASSKHLFVGAPEQDGGAVIAFRREPDQWTEAQMLTASDLGSKAQFGSALQWTGDQLLVGAPRAFNATGAVASYTYSKADTAWTRASRLLPFAGGPRQFFGAALAHDGTHLWIGAPGPVRMPFMYRNRAQRRWPGGTASPNQGGVVYQFRREEDRWVGAERIAHPGVDSGDGLGATLAANASVVAAGLPGDDYGAGTMALFSIENGTWSRSSPIAPTKGARFSAMRGQERTCSDGTVGPFSCNRIDLKSFLPIKSIGGRRGVHLTDIWGWTDPKTGTEYALVGRSDGIAFVDVSTPTDPVYVGELPQTEEARVNSWGDVKVYKNYAFVVADNAGDHGMQVFDLTRLRGIASSKRPVTFDADAHYDRVNSVHNIFVNDETGYAYLVGSSGGGTTCGGGLHMVNVQDPLEPTFEGCFADPSTGQSGTGSTHDVQCVVYQGPDSDYEGREICIGSNETAISIADVTDKDSTVAISTGSYPDYGYVHQGWFGENQRYFYQNDELDEIQGTVRHTRTLVWDLKDLDNPKLVNQVLLSESATDHNLYVEGSLVYESNYKSGLQVLDVRNPTMPEEVAHFDTKPYGKNDPGFAGTWSNYPYFESGIVVVSGIDEGLFVLEKPKQEL